MSGTPPSAWGAARSLVSAFPSGGWRPGCLPAWPTAPSACARLCDEAAPRGSRPAPGTSAALERLRLRLGDRLDEPAGLLVAQLVGDVGLGQDPDETTLLDDRQPPYLVLGHQVQSLPEVGRRFGSHELA